MSYAFARSGLLRLEELDATPSLSPIEKIVVGNSDLASLGNKIARLLTPRDFLTAYAESLVAAANASAARGVLELATTSIDEAIARFNGSAGGLQGSPNGPFITDAGSLLGKNSMHIGGVAAATTPPSNNANNMVGTGWHTTDASTTNIPVTGGAGRLFQIDVGNQVQWWVSSVPSTDGEWYFRHITGGTPGSWIKIMSTLSTATESVNGVFDQATDAEIRASTTGAHALTAEDLKTALVPGTLTDAATVAIDWSSRISWNLTITANRVLGNPTNEVARQTRTIFVIGDGATPRTLTFGTEYGGALPALTDITSTKGYKLTITCKDTSKFIVSAEDGSDP